MDEKIKVKDLATELGVSPKDLTRVLRELDVDVKNAASSVTPDDAAKAKARLQPENSAEVMRKEIQPGVIVRRRRRVEQDEAEEQTDAVSSVATPAEQEASVVTAKASVSAGISGERRSAKIVTPASKQGASVVPVTESSATQAVPAAQVAPAAEVAKKMHGTEVAGEKTMDAKDSAVKQKDAEQTALENQTAAEAAGQKAVTPEKPAKSSEAVSEETGNEAKAEHAEKRRKKKAPLETPPARVVRRVNEPDTPDTPAEQNAPSASSPSAAAEAAANTAAPVVAAAESGKPDAVAPAKSPASSASGNVSGNVSGDLSVDVSGAAPAKAPAAEGSTREGDAPLTAASAVVEKNVSAQDKAEKPRRVPAASAVPEGSSQPSLLPPVSESRRQREDGDQDDERPRRRPDAVPTPQVRVISRPDPSQARVVERAAPSDGRRDSRPDARDGRPGGFRPAGPGGPRPGGFSGPGGPRPAGPGGPRPAGPGGPGAPRPAGPGGPRPGGFTPPFGQQPPVEGTDQSRKKRNKGRRTVDFPQNGLNDFSRRRPADDDDGVVRSRSRGRKPKKHQVLPQSTQPMKAAKRKLRVDEAIRVADMAHQMGIKSGEIIKVLFGLGVMATINNALDIDTATLVAAEFGYEVEKVGFSEDTFLVPGEADSPEQLQFRPPVVTIMGHVDHGKTSLLDAIRKTSVTSAEAGGITQHIGAYHVRTKRGDIVFLDTPGHEAFTAMRARGAQVTDLVVLVVAADDGVMEQTREAINHSRAAGVPILVAVNKIDKETANPDRVLRELAELGLQAESWGGDTVVASVSAKTGKGLDELLELISLQAEIMELKANPDKPARGHVVEAKLDKGRGPVATVLIQEGTIHQGDAFVCGVFSGRVRALFSDQGRKIKDAGPSIPVEVQGFEGVPEAGEEFICLTDEKAARRIAESRAVKQRERELAKESRVTLETFLARSADTEEALVLNLVLKADVQGSLEAIIESLRKQSTDKVRIEIIHGGAGAISESDVMLAAASNAIVIGFNVRPTAKVKDVAEQEGVDIRFYDIIYKLMEEIKSAMTGMLAPVSREVYLGQAEVRNTFSLPKIGLIAGCFVADGKIARNAGVRLLRDGVVVYTGKIVSLKRFKDDAKEVPKGMECGMGLENFHDIKVGDIIEAFEMVEEAATL